MSRPPFKLRAPIPREWPLHEQIARVLTIEIAPARKVSDAGVSWFSIDHADFAGKVPGARLSRGVVAGISDIVVMRRGFTGWIEIKARDGELTDDQCAFIAAMFWTGNATAVARDAIEVLEVLDAWNIPRAKRTTIAA